MSTGPCLSLLTYLLYHPLELLLSLSAMPDSATPWTVACQARLSMGFSRQEYWSGLPNQPFIQIALKQGIIRILIPFSMETEEINSKALLEHKDKLVHGSSKIRDSNLNIITNDDELALKRIFF